MKISFGDLIVLAVTLSIPIKIVVQQRLRKRTTCRYVKFGRIEWWTLKHDR